MRPVAPPFIDGGLTSVSTLIAGLLIYRAFTTGVSTTCVRLSPWPELAAVWFLTQVGRHSREARKGHIASGGNGLPENRQAIDIGSRTSSVGAHRFPVALLQCVRYGR